MTVEVKHRLGKSRQKRSFAGEPPGEPVVVGVGGTPLLVDKKAGKKYHTFEKVREHGLNLIVKYLPVDVASQSSRNTEVRERVRSLLQPHIDQARIIGERRRELLVSVRAIAARTSRPG
jgi:hypothetical protein